ncbi:hypothetical protein ACIBKY_54770 [Nonomuraea sp. NPDC050394]|uniref:hypothetical protein n=1 Tax=Nonomuraea sp. NPDC050394 TaxID=3364363 RepID=UPI0037B3D532
MTIYVDVPDLGFGPASTALAVLAAIPDDGVHILATGESARHLLRERPGCTHHDVNTLRPPSCSGVVPPGALIVSITNPEFAAWALEQGHEVGVVDVLPWLWPLSRPAAEPDPARLRFHLVQAGFGPLPHGEPVAPVVDRALWRRSAPPRPDLAVIGFGGMGMRGADHPLGAFARWLLAAALPVLVDRAHVVVAGGAADLAALLPPGWARHPAVEVRPAVPAAGYATLLCTAGQVLIPAGMSTLHECASAGIAPFVQPGWTISTMLAAQRLAEDGYPHACRWPGQREAFAQVLGRPEPELIARAARIVAGGMADPDFLTAALRRFLERGAEHVPLPLVHAGLPRAADRLAEHVAEWLS